MNRSLLHRKVAILTADGVEESELTGPLLALTAEGAIVSVIAPESGSVTAMNHMEKGRRFAVNIALDEADADNYDALVLPGGLHAPDLLRQNPAATSFVQRVRAAGKPIAAICHGPWLLIEADLVRNLRVTSWPGIRTDLVHAGATWVDEPVVFDDGILTSRKPADIPAFNRRLIQEIASARPLASGRV